MLVARALGTEVLATGHPVTVFAEHQMHAFVDGRYRVGELLGTGSTATVHRAWDQRAGIDVAIKLLRPELARIHPYRLRFRREAQALSAVHHPGIVRLLDTGEYDTGEGMQPYLVMEFVDGHTLRDIVGAQGRLDPLRALQIVVDICDGLESSHRDGIVHGDITSSNVMMTRGGTVKIVDFSSARALSPLGLNLSTHAYRTYALREPSVGHWGTQQDMHSIGCLLHESLTGLAPPAVSVSRRAAPPSRAPRPAPHRTAHHDLPDRTTHRVLADLDAVLAASLDTRAGSRFRTVGDMRDAMLAALRCYRV